MLSLTCTTITSVDLAHYGVSRAKDWVSVDCGTMCSKYRDDLHRSHIFEAFHQNINTLVLKFIFISCKYICSLGLDTVRYIR